MKKVVCLNALCYGLSLYSKDIPDSRQFNVTPFNFFAGISGDITFLNQSIPFDTETQLDYFNIDGLLDVRCFDISFGVKSLNRQLDNRTINCIDPFFHFNCILHFLKTHIP